MLEQTFWIWDVVISVCIWIFKLVTVVIITQLCGLIQGRIILSSVHFGESDTVVEQTCNVFVSAFFTSCKVDKFASMNRFGLMYFSPFATLCNEYAWKCFNNAFRSLLKFWLLILAVVFIHCDASRVARIRATRHLGFLRHIFFARKFCLGGIWMPWH